MNQLRRLQLRSMPYEEYLKTEEWAAKREQTLERDEYRCRVCNEKEGLQVHHRTYMRRGDEDLNDLTTLCSRCHEHFHRIISKEYMIGQTYQKPSDPDEAKVFDTKDRKRRWEVQFLGVLLEYPECMLHVRGIINENDLSEGEARSLYQMLNSPIDQSQVESLSSAFHALAIRYRQDHPSRKYTAKELQEQRPMKDALQMAVAIKRMALLELNETTKQLLHESTEAGDKELERQYQMQLLETFRQLRTIDSATHLQG